MIEALNAGVAILILGLATFTIVARDSLAAAVGFIAYGLLLTLIWLQLHAVDVALMEGAVGGGLTGALVILAAARLRTTEVASRAERPGVLTQLTAAVLAGSIATALAICVLMLPTPAPTLAPEVEANIGATGVGNPITAVLLSFRAMDTLLEAIVLAFALIGVWSFTPDRVWGGRPGPLHHADPNGILTFLARVLPPIGIVVGIYIFWVGADLPGGKFQGATILAAMWLLVVRAGLTDTPPISRIWLRIGLIAGPLVFIAIGFAGTLMAGAFLAYPDGFAKPLILAIEWALMPSLALTLALLLVGVPQRPAA
jgi:multisubunit Na+/H+ antiporter MnhB subunit